MPALDAFDLAACDDAQPGRRAAAGDAQARHESFERYLTLARRLALRYRWSGEPPDDMIQVASPALLKIVDRWDSEMGYALSEYAMPAILGDLRHYSRDATWIVRPPRGLLDLRQWEIAAAIGCLQLQVSRIIKTSLERLSAHASMACGGWSTSDTT